MEKKDDASDYGAFLDQLSDQDVWMDYYTSGKRCVQQIADGSGCYRRAVKDFILISRSTYWYGLSLVPFMMLAVYSSVEKMDGLLVEAARDLGASPMYAFMTVTLKLTLPGLLSGVILTFVL